MIMHTDRLHPKIELQTLVSYKKMYVWLDPEIYETESELNIEHVLWGNVVSTRATDREGASAWQRLLYTMDSCR